MVTPKFHTHVSYPRISAAASFFPGWNFFEIANICVTLVLLSFYLSIVQLIEMLELRWDAQRECGVSVCSASEIHSPESQRQTQPGWPPEQSQRWFARSNTSSQQINEAESFPSFVKLAKTLYPCGIVWIPIELHLSRSRCNAARYGPHARICLMKLPIIPLTALQHIKTDLGREWFLCMCYGMKRFIAYAR